MLFGEANMTEGKKAEVVEAECKTCRRRTEHLIVSRVETSGASPDDDIRWWAEAQILQCRGCRTTSFREGWTSTEEWQPDNNELQWHWSQYPEPDAKRPDVKTHCLPDEVSKLYLETIKP